MEQSWNVPLPIISNWEFGANAIEWQEEWLKLKEDITCTEAGSSIDIKCVRWASDCTPVCWSFEWGVEMDGCNSWFIKSIPLDPGNIEEIGDFAFQGCALFSTFADVKLKSFSFASDSRLRKIARGAFRGCELETMYFPSWVEVVDSESFAEYLHLTSVLIPLNLKYLQIDSEVFRGYISFN